MTKEIHKLSLTDPELQEKLELIKQRLIAQAPEHIKKLGKILRKRSVFFMHRYLKKLGLGGKIKKSDLPLFMDWLITQRIDMKDMEPEARRNLREHTLENQSAHDKTFDYQELEAKDLLQNYYCRDCRWFREVPFGEEKDCVAMGAKGSDAICYGYTYKVMA